MVPLGGEGHASLGYVIALDLGARKTITEAERIGFGGKQKPSPTVVPSSMTGVVSY